MYNNPDLNYPDGHEMMSRSELEYHLKASKHSYIGRDCQVFKDKDFGVRGSVVAAKGDQLTIKTTDGEILQIPRDGYFVRISSAKPKLFGVSK